MAQLPDSGERRSFSTGSVRDKVDGKGAYHLMSPFPILQYALRMEDGMSKYGERNWEKGQPVMQFFNSGVRHMFNFLEDCLLGNEPKEDHLGAALWNIGGIVHTLKMMDAGLLPRELDDRPFPERVLGKQEEPEPEGTFFENGCFAGKNAFKVVQELRMQHPELFGEPELPECTIEDTHCCYKLADGCCDHPSEGPCEPEQPDMPKSPEEVKKDHWGKILKCIDPAETFIPEAHPELTPHCVTCRHYDRGICIHGQQTGLSCGGEFRYWEPKEEYCKD